MFCIYCGKPTEGENDTCPACAAIHVQPPVQPEPYAQPAPVYEQPAPTYQQHYPVYQQPAAVVDDELEADTFQLNIQWLKSLVLKVSVYVEVNICSLRKIKYSL